jgi:MFS family permease
MSHLALSMLFIGVFGACVGAVYVLGFTILGSTTSDEMRGRIFGVFYTLVRLCLLLAFTLAPIFSGVLNGVSNRVTATIGGKVVHHELGNSTFHVGLPGSRLTLWLAGLIIFGAAWATRRDLDRDAATRGATPSSA